jgi:predicted nucleotide-binding protein (sugar kinase/HSP70/actin superfamily)
VFAERMDNAIKSMNQATASVLSAARESSRVRSAVNERWDQVIRGVESVQNTGTGRTYQVDNRAARDLVDGLNASGNGNWKVLTIDELAPKR